MQWIAWFVLVNTYPLDNDLSIGYSIIQPSNNWGLALTLEDPAYKQSLKLLYHSDQERQSP